jgi:hypothetical protein
MGWLEDAARSGVTGLEQGVTSLVGTPRSISEGVANASVNGANWVAHALGQPGLDPQTTAALKSAVGQGPAMAFDGVRGSNNGGHPGGLYGASPAELDTKVQHAAGPYHAPQTWQGRLAQTVGQQAPGALLPGGPVARVARVAVPSLASFGAGEAARGTPYEAPAKAVAGVVGGLAEGAGEGALAAPERTFGNAMPNVTPEQVAQAAQLRANAAQQGISLTNAEAVQHVTGGATGLGRVQRLIESANRTAPDAAAYFAQRPGQVQDAVRGFTSDLAPNMPQQPGVLATQAQRAATGSLNDTRQAVNAMADPYYQQLAGQTLPHETYAQLAGDPGYSYALSSLQNDPVLSHLLTVHPPPPEPPVSSFAPSAAPGADPNAAGLAQALDDVKNYGSGRTGNLWGAMQRFGGVKLRDANGPMPGPDLSAYIDGRTPVAAINNANGLPPERMAQQLADAGWFGPNVNDPSAAFEKAFAQQASGKPVFHPAVSDPTFADRAQALDEEMTGAGVSANDPDKVAAQKLWDARSFDDQERAAVQAEGNANEPDPYGDEFDKLSAPRPPLDPYNSLANVNETVKQLDQLADNARPSPVNPFGNATKAGQYDYSRGLADALAQAASPEYKMARQLVANGRQALLEPLQSGPVGAIAGADNLGAQTSALFPAKPFPGQANATGSAIDALNGQRSNLGANLTGAHLAQALDAVSSDTLGRPNQFSGAAFVKNVAPGGEKAATLDAALQAIDPTGDTSSRFGDLTDALAATGWRERPGSMTAFNSEDLNGLKQAPGLIKFLGAAGDPLEWTKNIANWSGGKMYGRNLDVLANMNTDPDTAAVLQRALAAQQPGGLPAAALPSAIQALQSSNGQ